MSIMLRRLSCLGLTAVFVLLAGAASADESAVKQALQRKYPDIAVQGVAKTPMAGLYEVFADGEIFYVDAKVNFLFAKGSMIDVTKRTDLTEQRLRVLTAIKFEQLPLDLAFRIVKGSGKRKMAYFTDPNCPYCQRFDQDLAKVSDVTVHVFLYPILGQDSLAKARAVWCSDDRAKAYTEMMLTGVQPKPATAECSVPVDQTLVFGRQKGVNATPTIFFADGQRVSGAISGDELNKMLDGGRESR